MDRQNGPQRTKRGRAFQNVSRWGFWPFLLVPRLLAPSSEGMPKFEALLRAGTSPLSDLQLLPSAVVAGRAGRRDLFVQILEQVRWRYRFGAKLPIFANLG